jgi:hypothetical protein
MFQTNSCSENQSTRLVLNELLSPKIVAAYEIMWKNVVESSWNVMAHNDAREGKWSGNWRMEWVASTLHTTSELSELGVSSITTADAHTSAASSRLNWRLRRFKWTRPFRRKTKSGFCACAITFQTQSTARRASGDNIIRRMRTACWITKTTDTQSEYTIITACSL